MGFLSDNCTFKPLSKAILTSCSSFSCGNVDLDNFFTNKSIKYEEELLGKSYCFVLDDSPCVIVCAFTISNDSIDTYCWIFKKKISFYGTIQNIHKQSLTVTS